jgi:hypothetical protein
METPTIIALVCALVFLSIFSYLMMKISSKEQELDKYVRPKFEPRKMTYHHCTDTVEAPPKRKKKRYYNKKKKLVVANNAPVEKRPVGRPRKVQ